MKVKKVLFIGDSITDCGRCEDHEEEPYTRAYVMLVKDIVTDCSCSMRLNRT